MRYHTPLGGVGKCVFIHRDGSREGEETLPKYIYRCDARNQNINKLVDRVSVGLNFLANAIVPCSYLDYTPATLE